MKLELKHIVGYLPYELFVHYEKGDSEGYQNLQLDGVNTEDVFILIEETATRYPVDITEIKPILRSLDLTKEIEHNGEKLIPIQVIKSTIDSNLEWDSDDRSIFSSLPLGDTIIFQEVFQKLYEWHFDVHGLIDKGLAVDYNSISVPDHIQSYLDKENEDLDNFMFYGILPNQ